MRYEDDEDDFDENGVLKDGRTFRTPMRMMDSMQRAVVKHFQPSKGPVRVTDQFGAAGLGLNRPGYRHLGGGNVGDRWLRDGEARERADAYADWEHRQTNAWRDQGADAGENDERDPRISDSAAAAYGAYDNEIENAWRHGNK
jgi:hypothetical protein